jgi:hypothetical protein
VGRSVPVPAGSGRRSFPSFPLAETLGVPKQSVSWHDWRVGVDAEIRAGGGTLTLLYAVSDAERSVLRTMLVEAATGARVQGLEAPPGREDKYRLDIFNDPYLLEPADPNLGPGTPIGPDTMVQPTPAGREFVFVSAVLQRWLGASPAGLPEEEEWGEIVVPLLAGWVSGVTHAIAIADEPLTVAETSRAVPTLADEIVASYIVGMEEVGLLKASVGEDGEARYEPTRWLRLSIAPLAAAARMELRHPPGDTAPIAVAAVEAAFHLALPLLRLGRRAAGSCGLLVELDEEVIGGPVALTARVEGGRVVAIEPGLVEGADARAAAPASEWFDAVIDGAKEIEMSGEHRLAESLVKGLRKALFGRRR